MLKNWNLGGKNIEERFHFYFEIEMPFITCIYLTGITPAATSPTIIEVTVEELCISPVAKIPSIKPTIGFLKILDSLIKILADFPAMSLPADAIVSNEHIKKYIQSC